MIFSNLEITTRHVTFMKIKPLIELREMMLKALSGQRNLSKPFNTLFIEDMNIVLTNTGRTNFT